MARKPSQGKAREQKVSHGSYIPSNIGMCVAALALCSGVCLRFWWYDSSIVNTMKAQIKAAGGSADCVEPATFSGMRGLRAKCHFETGSVVTLAPPRAMLSLSTSEQRVVDKFPELRKAVVSDPDAEIILLALVLLRELSLGAQSLFAAYIASMPAEPPDIIALGDEEQIKAISSLLPKAEIRRDRMLQSIAEHVDNAPSLFANANEHSQKRALSLVLSRAHTYMLTPSVSRLVLIPFQDMANHDELPNCDQTCDGDGCKFVATRNILVGEQITHSYGAKSDLNLLYTYGFVSGSNYSALRVPSKDGVTSCGSSIMLDKVAPYAVEAEGAKCFQAAAGHSKFLETISHGCKEELMRLNRPSLSGVLSIGRINPYEALESLGARLPTLALDRALDAAIREEITTLKRCISESEQALALVGQQPASVKT